MSSPYIGQIMLFAGNFAPVGWAFCEGQTMSIAQNSALFALIGTTYGGNGVNTFNLPDFRGRVPKHYNNGPGLQPYVIGEQGGVENVTLLQTNMPAHTHLVNCDAANPGSQANPQNNFPATESTGTSANFSATHSATMNAAMIGSAGGSQPFNNLNPFLCVSFCIALTGIFPSRG